MSTRRTGKVEKTVTLSEKNPDGSRPQINDVVVDPTTHRAYFSDYKSGNIRVVDPNAADAVSSILVDKSANADQARLRQCPRLPLHRGHQLSSTRNYGRTLWQAGTYARAGALKSIVRADNLYPVDVDVDTNTGNIYMTDTRANQPVGDHPRPARFCRRPRCLRPRFPTAWSSTLRQALHMSRTS